MSRRTLDFVLSGGGLVLAVLLLIVGLLLQYEANYGHDYVKDQLGAQKITFAPADKLSDLEKTWKPGSTCLVDNGGKLMENGGQAECYANYYIALHLDESATAAGYPGETYATLGSVQTNLKSQVTTANQKGDTAGAAAAQKQLDSVTTLRASAQTGETLRGLLLTSYGFSIFADKAGQIAIVCSIMAGLLAVLAIFGFIHALRTPPAETVGLPRGYHLTPDAPPEQ